MGAVRQAVSRASARQLLCAADEGERRRSAAMSSPKSKRRITKRPARLTFQIGYKGVEFEANKLGISVFTTDNNYYLMTRTEALQLASWLKREAQENNENI